MRLYDLTDNYVTLLSQLEDAETEAEQQQILQAICDVETDIAIKAENYARIKKNAEAEAESLAKEIKRLQAMKAAKENLVQRVTDYLLFAMNIAGASEIKTSIGKWKIQKNPPKVNILDEAKVPARFLIEQAPKIDRTAILQEYRQTGEIFDGVEIVRTEGVRFR